VAIEAPRAWFHPLDAIPAPSETDLAGPVPRIATGVADFDHLSTGLPAGSVVLLAGDAGAGHQEFAVTSAAHTMFHYDHPTLHEFYLGSTRGPFAHPKGVAYVSLSRSREQVLAEIRGAFHDVFPSTIERHLAFHDLSPAYFNDSVVPSDWSSVARPLLAPETGTGSLPSTPGPLAALADALETGGPGNLVIVDSLTDLLVRRNVEPEALLTLVKGLRRRAKGWGGIVYLLLSRGVAPAATEQALYDSVDGVLAFSWTTSALHSHRSRTMLIEKFMPVLTRIPSEYQGRFVIQIDARGGLVTTQYERI